ncbi:27765_t:CDS:2, partial [Racocetra persica]
KNNNQDIIPFDKFLVVRLSKRWDFGIFKDARWKDSKERVALLFPKENNQFSKVSDEILKLKDLNHNNIIRFYGVTYDKENETVMFALQLTAESLCEYLTNHSHPINQTDKLNTINQTDKLNIAKDVASGLEFLHKHSIVQGDL